MVNAFWQQNTLHSQWSANRQMWLSRIRIEPVMSQCREALSTAVWKQADDKTALNQMAQVLEA